MSHITRIESILISDLDTLTAACKLLGLEVVRGQTQFRCYEGLGACEHAIRVPGDKEAYEIGLVREGAGYKLVADDILYRIGMHVGRKCGKLRQYYAAETTARKLSKSYHVRRTVDQGRIKLHVTEKR